MAKVCGTRRVGKGVHSIYSGCSCSRWVYTSVLFIVVEVRVITRSSLYIIFEYIGYIEYIVVVFLRLLGEFILASWHHHN